MDITKITIEDEIETMNTDDAKPEPRPVVDEDRSLVITKSVETIKTEAEAIAVTDAKSQADAAAWLRKLKATQKDVDAHFGPIKRLFYKPYKEACDKIKLLDDSLKGAERKVKKALTDYQLEEDRKRRVKEAEDRRIEQEAEDARLAKIETDRIAREEAEEKGEPVPEPEPEPIPVPVAAPEPIKAPPKLAGVSMRDNWTFEVTDLEAVPDVFIIKTVDEKALNGMAKSTKGKKEIPGIKFVNRPVVSARA